MQHLAGVGPGGQQGVVAEHPGIAVGRALLGVPVDLTDGGVHTHRQRLLAWSGSCRPGAGEDLFSEAVQLPNVAEGEGPQERSQRGGRQHPVAEHRRGRAGPQQLGVVDAVPTRHQGVDQGQHLAARMSSAGAVAEVDQLISQLLHAQPLRQRGRQHQPSVGDCVVVVEGDGEPVGAVGG
jgi:hypothetical protein